MEVLQKEMIKYKKITVYLVKKQNYKERIKEIKKIMNYFKYIKIDFATVDLESEDLEEFTHSCLGQLLHKRGITYFPIDIPECAKNYFYKELFKKEDLLNDLVIKYINAKKKHSYKVENLKFWIDVHSDDIKEKKEVLNSKLKPQRIVETIADLIETIEKKNINIIHFGEENTFSEIMKLLKGLNIDTYYMHFQ